MTWRGQLFGAVLLSAVAIAIAGCGDSESADGGPGSTEAAPAQTAPDSSRAVPLSPAAARVIERTRDEVDAYCRRVGQALGGGEGPTPSDFDRVSAALDQLAALAAQDPQAQGPDGTTPRLALGDIAENLEGTNCDPRLVTQIDSALASLPAE